MALQLSPQVYTWLCGAFASLGSVLLGYDLGIIASVIPAPDFFVTMGIPDEQQIGLIVSLMLLGAFTSNLGVGYLADTYGRRPSILVGCIIFMLGGALQTGAKGLHWMYAGRFIAGLGIGMLAMLAPLYQSEIAHPAVRGRVTALQQFMIGIGAFTATMVGYGCFKNLTGPAQWRTPLGIQLLPSFPLALFILLLPESPRYLASKGRNSEALHTLARLHANGDVHDPFVKGEYAEILEAIASEQASGSGTYFELLTTPTLLRRVVLGCSLQFGLQMTGIAALEYYSPTIFAAMGFDTTTTLALQAGSAALALVAEILCIAYIDRLGRRTPLITTVALCGFSFLLISILQAKYGQGPRSAQIGFVAVTWFYTFMFSCGIGPLAWAVPVEMFGSKWRGKATAVTSAAQWISNFMIAQITPIALKTIGAKYWIVFAVCGFADALFYWAFLPETRGVPLEEVDAYFAKVPLFVPTSNVPVPTMEGGEQGLRAKGAAMEGSVDESVEDEKVAEV